jgi:phage I-like protein
VPKGGPIPGAGWIHGLNANGKLSALVEWTPQAEEMLRRGQYRFFSPAIDWGVRDKTTGEPLSRAAR